MSGEKHIKIWRYAGKYVNLQAIIEKLRFMSQMGNYSQGQVAPQVVFDSVMDYLHAANLSSDAKKVIANLLLDEAIREEASTKMREQFRLKKDLEHFSTFAEDWDGEGSVPLQEASLQNFELLLPLLSARALQGIDISPENNGTLLITSRLREAGVNIGDNTYTYYSVDNGQVNGKSRLTFDADKVLEQIENLVK